MRNTNETYYKEIVKSKEFCICNKVSLASYTRDCSHVLGLNAEPHIIYINRLKSGKCYKSYVYGYIEIKVVYLDIKDGKKKLIQSYFPFGEEIDFEEKSIDVKDLEVKVVCKNYKLFNNELLIYLILEINYKVKIPIILENEDCKNKPIENIKRNNYKKTEDRIYEEDYKEKIYDEARYEERDMPLNRSDNWIYDSSQENNEEIIINNDYYDYLGGN